MYLFTHLFIYLFICDSANEVNEYLIFLELGDAVMYYVINYDFILSSLSYMFSFWGTDKQFHLRILRATKYFSVRWVGG